MKRRTNARRLIAASLALLPTQLLATNGMNLEGYGPIATGMGGAAAAYDNGTAAVMNNPATLGLMDSASRLDVALGILAPDVQTTGGGMSWDSNADQFYMPAVGWATQRDSYTYGVGLFAQGGMGTEYTPGPVAQMAGTNLEEMSQVSVGRIVVPLTWQATDQWIVGGSVDFVWANLDLRLLMTGAQMTQMAAAGLITGSLAASLGGANYGYFDFADGSDFTGAATGTGFAGKIGAVYRLNNQLSFGATYHSKTNLADLEANDETLTLSTGGGTQSVAGDITIRDFEWPAQVAVGVAYQPMPNLMLAADVKWLQWSDVMENFQLGFVATEGAFADQDLNATLPQEWEDQTILALGASYAVNDALTLRAGYNRGENPIPDANLHYLFPAIVEDHYTLGFGYVFGRNNAFNGSVSYAPEVSATNPTSGLTTSMSQLNWQFMYSRAF